MTTITEYRLMYQIEGVDPLDRWRCAVSNTSLEHCKNQRLHIRNRPLGSEKNWTFRIESRTVTTTEWEVSDE